MSIFQNTTMHTLPIMINGVRRNIRPGEQINGPDSLSSVPGLSLINSFNKSIIPKQIIPENLNNNQINKINNEYNIPKKYILNNSINSNFNSIIDDELEYLKNIKNLGNVPSITIAILTKDRFDLIKNCCQSIFDKVQYINTTLLIIDTGSKDPNVLNYYNTLKDQCDKKSWKYKFIQLDYFQYSKNYNYIIKNHIDTEYVLLQNNDTTAINDYVSEMISIGLLNKVGSVGCRMFYPDGSIQHDGQTFYNGPHNIINSPTHINLKQVKQNVDTEFNKISLVDGNTAAGVLIRTKDYLKIDGMDEEFKDIFQDVELMAKIPHMLNKFNYCNKNAEIYHIDNASRKSIGFNQNNINHDVKYIETKLNQNGMMHAKYPKQVDFSIITLVRNLDDYTDFLNSLRNQIGSHTVELIAIPNFYNTFTSAYKGLNYGASVASGEILIYCHEDILITPDWLNKIKNNIIDITSKNERIGVIGPAGISLSQSSVYYFTNENGNIVNNYGNTTRIEVQSLDELCLITLNSSNLRFNDKNFDGFHFYGADICLNAKLKGMKNYAINAYCYHKSDGSKNLKTSKQFSNYEHDAVKFNEYAKSKGIYNWRTTTAKCVNGNIHFFPKRP